jgi:hypothetical protein
MDDTLTCVLLVWLVSMAGWSELLAGWCVCACVNSYRVGCTASKRKCDSQVHLPGTSLPSDSLSLSLSHQKHAAAAPSRAVVPPPRPTPACLPKCCTRIALVGVQSVCHERRRLVVREWLVDANCQKQKFECEKKRSCGVRQLGVKNAIKRAAHCTLHSDLCLHTRDSTLRMLDEWMHGEGGVGCWSAYESS